jgi:hypothetical protein
MRLVLVSLAALGVAAPAMAQQTKSYSLSGFDRVKAIALMEVELKQGPFSVQASEPKGNFSDLKLEVKNGELIVTRPDGHNKGELPEYKVVVTAPSWKSIEAGAVSNIEGRNLNLQDVEILVTSAGSVELEGACRTLTLHVNSAGDFDGQRFRCTSAKVKASSGANADVWASGTAEGAASAGGSIRFHGFPKKVEKKTSLGGSVRTN